MRKILGKALEKMRRERSPMIESRFYEIIRILGCPCLACKGLIQKINVRLVEELIKLEEYIGQELTFNSGRRCEAENARVGGYPNSPHIFGKAVDIIVKGMSLKGLALICEKFAFLRIGIYPNHIHLDMVTPNPSKFWYVRKYGEAPVYSGNIKSLDEFFKKLKI